MIFFLLAAYNESGNIGRVLSDISRIYGRGGARVILVDDGSTDGTAEEARSVLPEVEIITHSKNEGLGAALKNGFNRVFSSIGSEDALVTLDADNTHPIELSRKMIEMLAHADIVVASRYAAGASETGLSVPRRIMSRAANLMLGALFPHKNLRDYTSGYRAFSGSFLIIIREKYGERFVTERGFTATPEILLKSLRLNPIPAEAPLNLRYDLRKGKSKMKVLRTIASYLFLTIRNKFCT
jgi:dolichol-phosphate mannosyltransferase